MQAYHQMQIDEESEQYLTINTHLRLCRYNHLLLGVSSATAIFESSRVMDNILQEQNRYTQVIASIVEES